MRYKLFIIIMLIACCGCAHPYMGVRVNPAAPLWCKINTVNESCTIETEHLKFVFTTGQKADTGEYTIKGYAEIVSVKSFSRFHTEKSSFYFILSNDGIVIDVISFMLANPNIKGQIPIDIKFKSKGFDAVTITYEFVTS